MAIRMSRRVLFLVICLAISASGVDASRHPSLLEPLAIRAAVDADSGATERALRRTLKRLEREAREAIDGSTIVDDQVKRFNRFFFRETGFAGEQDRNEIAGTVLSHVLTRRRGTCVGLAQVYMILAERLGLPLVAAATPAHLFVRWIDRERRINVELLENGKQYSDEDYRSRQPLREPDSANPVFLRDLSAPEVAARIHNNLGTAFSRAEIFPAAEAQYARAIDLDSRFPAPYYNRGLDRLNSGRQREALEDFERALSLHPADAWALNNRGLARLALGDRAGAEADFREALSVDPGLAAARENLARLRDRAR
jgi:regulator of sirC expression with transglutaminase-like and TPR domain